MSRIEMYGKVWEVSSDPKLGQIGLIAENHYRPLFAPGQREKSFAPDDRWLDVGANIGAFTVRAAEFVQAVVAVEPEPECLLQLENNLRLNNISNVEIVDAAVVETNVPSVMLALSNSFSSTHRVGKIRGREMIEVRAEHIDTLIYEWTINKVKMDCEGSEVAILEDMELEPIEEIVFEYHFSYIKDRPWERYFAILSKLRDNGFEILRGANKQTKTWHTIVWARR